jgi:ferredoxin
MKVAVDDQACQGHARCWEICPEVFSLDDEGFSTAAPGDVPPELEHRVREAVDNCPERAISLS